MKSTGEVMGLNDHGRGHDENIYCPGVRTRGLRFSSHDYCRQDKRIFENSGFVKDGGWKIFATHGTAQYLSIHGIEAELVRKIGENSVSDRGFSMERVLLDGYVDVVINMFTKGGKEERDGFKIRSLASQKNIRYLHAWKLHWRWENQYRKNWFSRLWRFKTSRNLSKI